MAVQTDNFNRTDSTDLGASWVPFVGSLTLATNKVRATTLSVEDREYYNGDIGGADHYTQAVVDFVSDYGNVELLLRCKSTGEYYSVVLNQNSQKWELIRYNPGYVLIKAQGASAEFTWTVGQTKTLKATCSGSTPVIRLYVDGVEATGSPVTDGSGGITNGTRGGIGVSYVGVSVGAFTIDSFEAGLIEEPTFNKRRFGGVTHAGQTGRW